jgi:hypothetical protein
MMMGLSFRDAAHCRIGVVARGPARGVRGGPDPDVGLGPKGAEDCNEEGL